MINITRRFAIAAVAAAGLAAPALAQAPKEIRLDYATYNPVSLVLKERGILEKALEADGIKVRWVLSAGSNKALEFLNAGSIDFGSTAGAAALIGKINGNPIKSVYVYSRPEWTALVTGAKSEITKVADLKGRRVAVTRGTDPHIFLVRALADARLTEKDVKLVLLQHADGRLALERGDVEAWAGLDPLMAAAEVESGAKLFYRKAEDNTWGILNVREAFAKENPALVRKVIAAYEQARAYALANPAELNKALVEYTKLSEPVIERQLTRTELTHSAIGQAQIDSITAA
ncbi:aliphatic sulfonate ABC transporter substrate-binding protein, partial [Bosea sp. CER48]|uniref:aliphatic sulfonate ABC transporter substrate-binding protein n=1 Tax=Bosea sp. CER48 TaxID=3377035 RepID=UPI003818F7A8